MLKQYDLSVWDGSELRNKLNLKRRHENHDANRNECDDTTKRIRLEGKIFNNFIILLYFYIKFI